MAVQDQNDARGTARLLASTAKRTIEESTDTPGSRVALGGLFRLLKAYRSHRLAGFEYQPRRDPGLEGMTIVSPAESHVGDLRSALNSALGEIYTDTDQDAALESLERVLRSVANKKPPQPDELQRTTAFLGSFLQKLEAVG
jgi:hypothetical protein